MINSTKNDILFLVIILAFCADAIINYFKEVPLFVGFSPIFCMALTLFKPNKQKTRIAMAASVLLFLLTLKVLYRPINLVDYSDLFLLSLAVISFNHYIRNPPSKLYVHLAFCSLIFIFLPTFFGLDGSSKALVNSSADYTASANLEIYRTYRSGFFRVAHVAAYAFFIYFLMLLVTSHIKKSNWLILASILLLLLSFLVGSRVPIASLVFSIPLYYGSRSLKTIPIAATAIVMIVIAFLNIDSILEITSNTILFQYFSSLKTLTTNPEYFSRAIIWSSWLDAMEAFNALDLLVGRSLSESFTWNMNHLGTPIWFHNDFLGVFYAYGLLGFVFYLAIYYELYLAGKKHKTGLYFFSITFFIFFAAFTNGFYKYLPYLIAAALSVLLPRKKVEQYHD